MNQTIKLSSNAITTIPLHLKPLSNKDEQGQHGSPATEVTGIIKLKKKIEKFRKCHPLLK
jgi:hypothetical protein